METAIINGLLTLKFTMLQTAALGVAMYYFGVLVRYKIPIFVKLSVPAAAIGGLTAAFVFTFLQYKQILGVTFDITLQSVLMLIFFCTVGMNASYKLLTKGGLMILAFLGVSTIVLVFQNILGISIAKFFGLDPLMGLIGGSVTLTGGLGTAGAFGPLFENNFGVEGAVAAGMACATFGIVVGSLVGGPLAEWIIKTKKVPTPHAHVSAKTVVSPDESSEYEEIVVMEQGSGHVPVITQEDDLVSGPHLMKNLAWVIVSVGLGSIISFYVKKTGFTLPDYLCGMIVAVIVRNVGDATKAYEIDTKAIGMVSDISLAIFVTMAISTLKIWSLLDLALPLLAMMLAQVILILFLAYFLVYKLLGKDYDATVMSAGLIGFGCGAMPNALANMQTVAAKYGPAQRAFFVVPIVGAFLIDFINAVVITFAANFFR